MSKSGSEKLPLGWRGLVHMALEAIPEAGGPFPFVLINPVLCFSPEHLQPASPLLVSLQWHLGSSTSCFDSPSGPILPTHLLRRSPPWANTEIIRGQLVLVSPALPLSRCCISVISGQAAHPPHLPTSPPSFKTWFVQVSTF